MGAFNLFPIYHNPAWLEILDEMTVLSKPSSERRSLVRRKSSLVPLRELRMRMC